MVYGVILFIFNLQAFNLYILLGNLLSSFLHEIDQQTSFFAGSLLSMPNHLFPRSISSQWIIPRCQWVVGRILKALVVVDNSLEHCREIYLNEQLWLIRIAHATRLFPYYASEDSVALDAPYDLTCASFGYLLFGGVVVVVCWLIGYDVDCDIDPVHGVTHVWHWRRVYLLLEEASNGVQWPLGFT